MNGEAALGEGGKRGERLAVELAVSLVLASSGKRIGIILLRGGREFVRIQHSHCDSLRMGWRGRNGC